MELSVALFVFLLIGAALVGLTIGTGVARWRRAHEARSAGNEAERQAVLKAELDDARRTARRELQNRNRLRDELDEATAELARLRTRLDEVAGQLVVAVDEAAVASREAGSLKAKFSDVVGLEAENTTLRAIASRVPELERRLAECEPEGLQVIDLREGSAPTSR